MTMTQYAYLTPSGDLASYSFDAAPPITFMGHAHLDEGSADEELVIAGPRQYTHLIDGEPADLEALIAALVAILPRWVTERSPLQRTLGEALHHLAIGAPNLSAADVRSVLGRVDSAVRASDSPLGVERASAAWVANLVAVLTHVSLEVVG